MEQTVLLACLAST